MTILLGAAWPVDIAVRAPRPSMSDDPDGPHHVASPDVGQRPPRNPPRGPVGDAARPMPVEWARPEGAVGGEGAVLGPGRPSMKLTTCITPSPSEKRSLTAVPLGSWPSPVGLPPASSQVTRLILLLDSAEVLGTL